jgi:hypothetical protein
VVCAPGDWVDAEHGALEAEGVDVAHDDVSAGLHGNTERIEQQASG